MSGELSFYDLLGVSRTSELVVIEAAYKALMKKHHPDRKRSDAAAEEHAKRINEAYATLRDPQKRARYDRTLSSRARRPPPCPSGGAASAEDSLFGARPREWASSEPAPTQFAPSIGSSGSYEGSSAASKRIALLISLCVGVGLPITLLVTANDPGHVLGRAGGDRQPFELLVPSQERTASQTARSEAQDFAAGVSPSSVIAGARTFRQILTARGIGAAESYSRACFRALAQRPTLAGVDFCSSFDAAGTLILQSLNRMSGVDDSPYFSLVASQQRSRAAMVASLHLRDDAAVEREGALWGLSTAYLKEAVQAL